MLIGRPTASILDAPPLPQVRMVLANRTDAARHSKYLIYADDSHVMEGAFVSPCGKAWPMLPGKVNSWLLVSNGVYPFLWRVLPWTLLSDAIRGCSSAVPVRKWGLRGNAHCLELLLTTGNQGFQLLNIHFRWGSFSPVCLSAQGGKFTTTGTVVPTKSIRQVLASPFLGIPTICIHPKSYYLLPVCL